MNENVVNFLPWFRSGQHCCIIILAHFTTTKRLQSPSPHKVAAAIIIPGSSTTNPFPSDMSGSYDISWRMLLSTKS